MEFRHVLMTEHFCPLMTLIERVSIVIQLTDQIRATGNIAGVTLFHERFTAQTGLGRIDNTSYFIRRRITEPSARTTASSSISSISSTAITATHAHHGTGTFQLHQLGNGMGCSVFDSSNIAD